MEAQRDQLHVLRQLKALLDRMVGPQVIRVVEGSPKLYRRGLQILGAAVELILELVYGNETLYLDI